MKVGKKCLGFATVSFNCLQDFFLHMRQHHHYVINNIHSFVGYLAAFSESIRRKIVDTGFDLEPGDLKVFGFLNNTTIETSGPGNTFKLLLDYFLLDLRL